MISIIPPIESRSYLELTMEALAAFGVNVCWTDDKTILIRGNQHYKPANVTVEGDYSNAAFFAALKLFGADIEITGLSEQSRQGDKAYLKFYEMLEKERRRSISATVPTLDPC